MRLKNNRVLYGNEDGDYLLCEYLRELNLLKILIDIVAEDVEKTESYNPESFEGVCASFANSIVRYSQAAYDNMVLGHFNIARMINRSVIENYVCLRLIIDNKEEELWKDYLVYSCLKLLTKFNRIPNERDMKDIQNLYGETDVTKAFLEKPEPKRKAYIKEDYGWTYKINHNKCFNFQNMCDMTNYKVGYDDFRIKSDFSHGTLYHTKLPEGLFAQEILDLILNTANLLRDFVYVYCLESIGNEFQGVYDKLLNICVSFLNSSKNRKTD